ncbi:MAG TPA: hypothetical protein VH479_00415 [Acidimicrobiales bacterium]
MRSTSLAVAVLSSPITAPSWSSNATAAANRAAPGNGSGPGGSSG